MVSRGDKEFLESPTPEMVSLPLKIAVGIDKLTPLMSQGSPWNDKELGFGSEAYKGELGVSWSC